MKRGVVFAVLVAAVAWVLMAPSAMASPWLNVHIEVLNLPDVPEPYSFDASGPAVENGLIFATGLQTTGPITVSPSPEGDSYLILSMVKYFAYGDGTLSIQLVVTLDLIAGRTYGTWKVQSGTGNCAGIRGNGKLVGTRTPGGFLDVWDGKLRVEPVLDVYIEVLTPLPATGADPFSASGPAVVRGLVPATGTVSTGPITVSPSPLGDRYIVLSMVKYFVCDTGTFDVNLVVDLDTWGVEGTFGNWRILRGTGSFADLKGNGTLVGVGVEPSSVLDMYTGKLRR